MLENPAIHVRVQFCFLLVEEILIFRKIYQGIFVFRSTFFLSEFLEKYGFFVHIYLSFSFNTMHVNP